MADKYYDMGAMQAFYDKIKTLFQTIANKVTSWSSTPSDDKYPSEKLVKAALDGKANDSDVVHKAGEENITGNKVFKNGVEFFSTSGSSGYGIFVLPDTGGGTAYNNWPEEYKDGAHFREWTLHFPAGVNFWGRIRITFIGGYSGFNASGSISKTILCAFNGSNVYNNTGSYDALGINIENEFRISDLIWDNTNGYWTIKIHSIKPTSNNNVIALRIEFGCRSDYVSAVRQVTWSSTTPSIVTDTTYYTKRSGNAATDPTSGGVLFNWADKPVFQSPYGYEIFDKSHIIPIANGGTGATTKKAAEYAINGGMAQGSGEPQDSYQFVFSRVGSDQSATNGVFLYRTAATIWSWIKGKISSILGLTATDYSGNAATASAAQAGSELESELNSKVDASELADLSLNATYLESNRRLVFDDIIFDNIYPMLGKYGLATFPEDTAVVATAFSGDKDWLLDWRPYLIDMTPVAGETGKKPVAELMRNNWLRKTDGEYAPVCGITAAQAAALNGKKDTLYWKTGSAGDKVSATISTAFDSSGNFVPSAFWEYIKANLSTVNTKAGVTYAAPIEVKVYVGSQAYEFGSYTEYHIPAPWETTETKYSVFIGRDTDVYLVDGYSETTGEHMRGLTAKPVPVGSKEFDPEFFKLRRTGISPGPSTTVGNKTRNFFYNYNGTDSNTKGNAGSLSILVNNGTYPRTNDASQYTTANWARSNNSGGSSGNAVPVGEGGYHSLNAFLCSVEAAYQTRNICAPTAFSTGNSSNDACNSAATYRTNGGFMLTYNGSTTYHQISADLKSRLGTSSSVYVYNVINNQYAHFQCMEPQIAASLAAEMGIAVNTDFMWNGGTWHYETPSAFTVADLSNGRMNCRIYKDIAFTDKTLGGVSGCSGSVNLRCSLIEGMNTVGDIWWYQGGGAELIYMTDGTGATNYKYSFYLEPDQAKWIATSTDEKHTNGSLFTCENAYRCLIEDSTTGTLGNTYCLSRTGYTPVRRSNGGAVYTGECCFQHRQIDDDAKGSTGIRSRRTLRFRGNASNSNCSPRSLNANIRPSTAIAHIGCSAQVLLQ